MSIGEAPETCMAAWGPSPWAMVGVGICQGSEWTEEPEEPALPWWVSGWAPSRALAWPHLGMPMLRAHVQGLGVQGPLQHESRVRRPKPPLHPRPELCLWHLFQKQRPLLFSVWAPAAFVPRWACSASPSPTGAQGPVLVQPALKEVSGSFSSFYSEAWEKNKSEKHFQK